MPLVTQLEILFAGSFQARLAVGGDGGASSPTDPYGVYGLKSQSVGATFSYKEKPFDRIIRLSKPVDLRNALIDPWKDTTVSDVNLHAGKGHNKPAPPGNPLVGRVVSLGEKVKFIEDEGYEIDGLMLSIAPFLMAQPAERVSGWKVGQVAERKAEYQKEKPARIKAANGQIDPIRTRVLNENLAMGVFDTWATIYTNFTVYTFRLAPHSLQFTAQFGGNYAMDPPAHYAWEASLVFSRWDADALGGQLLGAVGCMHKSKITSQPGRPR